MNEALEIRKLSHKEHITLVYFLEQQESWKKLMSIIPKNLNLGQYECDITVNNPAKYHSEHVETIQRASGLIRKDCSDILLREWGTSGRVRPTLGHLKCLLAKAELFHAAEFISVQVLKQTPLTRPAKGPGAHISFGTEELTPSEAQRIEKRMNEINYPYSSLGTNLNVTAKNASKIIPKIIISESPDSEKEINRSFTTQNPNIPVVIDTSSSDDSSSSGFNSSNANVPNFSIFLSDNPVNNNSNSNGCNNIPVVVQDINDDSSGSFTTSGERTSPWSQSSSNMPAFSDLLSGKSIPKSRPCTSPLPNLSLNTQLPHFTYSELERATNSFDETPGRFLGAGNFGQVYLAEDLFDRPVAVKKLLLKNTEVVEVDDQTSKQFKTEVEVLGKYKQDNLVSLLGYSCDGLTYCLVYEYVPGGALKERLQKHALIWTERLYIALGTARAIDYLHTAYSTPLIHRDIKSANILLDVTNKPKLCDFGLIKHCMTQNTYTATTIMGTSAYMAPEAFRGDISMKLDVFSFGVVLLELLTSKAPMDESREGRDLVSHVEEFCKGEEIKPLLDVSVGSWMANDINFGQKLYEIALDCLQVRKQLRPTMSLVFSSLNELIKKAA